MTLNVNEIFGPTFQGEGRSLGRRAVFLRLAGCNLHCTWCDTPYTWDWSGKNGHAYMKDEEMHVMSISEVANGLALLMKQPNTLLVISGGEPLLQWRSIGDLLLEFGPSDVEIETNGTVIPGNEYWNLEVRFNVSPKLAHSGNDSRAINPRTLEWFAGKDSIFKFVVTGEQDFDEIEAIAEAANIRNEQIWIMPEGVTELDIRTRIDRIADEVLKREWNLTTRLHVLLWGDKRGR